MAESKAAASSSLALYWELASTNGAIRLKAAKALVETLQHFQKTHSSAGQLITVDDDSIANEEDAESIPLSIANSTGKVIATQDDLTAECAPDLCYGLKRLLRGLPSARQGARQGFSMALTEVCYALI